jgi:hypothetical protein
LGVGCSIGGANPIVASKLYWSVVIPGMLHGTEVMCIPGSDMDKFEVEHRKFGKRIQGLPVSTSNPASYAALGWWSIQAYVDRQKMMLLHGILSVKTSCIYKQVAIARLTEVTLAQSRIYKGPIADMFYTCKKYNLQEHIIDLLETGEKITKSEWKKLVIYAITYKEFYAWKTTCLMYKKLNIYRLVITNIQPSIWWHVAYTIPHCLPACKLVMRLISGELGLRVNTGRFTNIPEEERICELCGKEVETELHFVLVCEVLSPARQPLITYMHELQSDYENLGVRQQLVAILGNIPNPTTNLIELSNIAKSIYHIYKIRKAHIDGLQ